MSKNSSNNTINSPLMRLTIPYNTRINFAEIETKNIYFGRDICLLKAKQLFSTLSSQYLYNE